MNISEITELNTKPRLDEVTLMRTILALLIVFMHSFTCYNGSWAQPAGYVDIPLYKWLARTSFAFSLEAFVFLSGYLFALQRITLQRTDGLGKLVVNKFKRLILPSIIFSVIYFVLFYDYKGVGNAVYTIINGCGHMWFLPMLFWCFVIGWLLEQVKIKDAWKMAFLVVLNLLPFPNLPFRISTAFIFMVYFYGGFLFFKYRERITSLVTLKNLIVSWLVFIILFAVLRPLRDVLTPDISFHVTRKVIVLFGNHACQWLYASVGLFAFYGTVVWYIQRYQLSEATKKIAAFCFGTYLFQQFVLELLYYKTSFPLRVGPYWLPWFGFFIASIISFVFSALLVKTKTGRFLIG